MSKILETKKVAKNGIEVTLLSPPVAAGGEILEVVKGIMRKSEHLLTEQDELTFTAQDEEEMIRAYTEHPDKVIIVPKVAGKIIGMMDFRCGLRRRISHQGEFGMSIEPAFQGLGIGRMMLDELVKWATGNPRIETLRLSVHAKNVRAIALYRSAGFSEEGRQLNGVRLGKASYDDVIAMARSVKSPGPYLAMPPPGDDK